MVARVTLLGSGTLLREVIAAAEMLRIDFGIGADVWSVTSFTELRRDGLGVERYNRLHPSQPRRQSWVEACLHDTQGPVIAVTDYMRTVPDLIRAWIPGEYVVLGTDGFGRSDTRVALRDFFEVDRKHVAIAALSALAGKGTIDVRTVSAAIVKYDVATDRRNPWDV
jgi:pyruvate dehydrogenase E1 component